MEERSRGEDSLSIAYSGLVMSSHPVAYWRLDDSSVSAGATATDVSGNGNNGVYHGTWTGSQTGVVVGDSDTAALGDGTTAFISTSSHFTDGLAAVTLECWVNLTSNGFVTFPKLLQNSQVPTTNHLGVALYLAPAGNGKAGFFECGNGTIGKGPTFGTDVLNTGAWHHIVGVYDGVNVIAYLDGTKFQSSAMTGTIGAAGSNIFISKRSSATADFVPGTLDEIAIYNTALSATQILNHYNTALANNPAFTPGGGLYRGRNRDRRN